MRQVKDKLTTQHVIVSTIVPMVREGKLFTYSPVVASGETRSGRSAAELVAEEVGNAPVVSALELKVGGVHHAASPKRGNT